MRTVIFAYALVLTTASHATAEFTYFDDDADGWFAAVPEFTTLDFVGLEPGVLAMDAYSDLGVLFIDEDPNFVITTTSFPRDGWGINGRSTVRMSFTEPAWAFGMHFPGIAYARFFRDGDEVFRTPGIGGGGGSDFFEGFTTTEWFDEVELVGNPPIPGIPDDIVFFDNFYFATVPGPGALALLGLGATRRRRRA